MRVFKYRIENSRLLSTEVLQNVWNVSASSSSGLVLAYGCAAALTDNRKVPLQREAVFRPMDKVIYSEFAA
jgi:hypothetical protein